MLQKLSNFIVDHRKSVLILLTILTLFCAILFFQVPINTDMTKYLPDDSMMKMGIDKMEEEFPDTTIDKTIRVMFTDLTETEKLKVLTQLSAIPNVDTVAYDATSTDYNKDNYTLYIVSTSFDYGSPEEKSIESTIQKQFAQYTMELKNDEANSNPLTIGLVIFALTLLFAILFLMCYSWTEPFLFIITIGFAVILNMGTNIFLGSISNVTASVAAILQLVLSMDYSIILMNRYRQELEMHDTREEAMKAAIINAFSSVTSSSFTTFIGLLMLVFMSFKIGFDLGIVLAKGVVISLFCVLTVLPGLILLCHDLIMKTAKPALHFSMRKFAVFSHKFKYIMAAVFVFLFVGSYFAQQNTQIYYALETPDPIANIFPTKNSIILLYQNEEESKVTDVIAELENHQKTKEILGYATTLGKSYNTTELSNLLTDMDTKLVFQEDLLNLLYYDYYTEDTQLSNITVGEFLTFLTDNVITNPAFSEHIEDDILMQATNMKQFSNANNLTKQMTLSELSNFFGLNTNDVKQLVLYYYISHKDTKTDITMTLPTFVSFVQNDLLSDETYVTLLADNMNNSNAIVTQMQPLQTFTDTEAMTTPISAEEMSTLLSMDITQMNTLYNYYQMSQTNHLSDMQGADINNSAQGADLSMMADMDLSMPTNIEPSMIDPSMYTALTPEQLAMLQSSMEEQTATPSMPKASTEPILISVQDLIHFLLKNEQVQSMLDAETIQQLTFAQTIIECSIADTQFNAADLAALFGMDIQTTEQLYLIYISKYGDTSNWKLSVQQFINFLLEDVLTNDTFADQFSPNQLQELQTAKILINAVVSQIAYSPEQMTTLMQSLNINESFNENIITLLYLYHDSLQNIDKEHTMTLEALANYLANHIIQDPKYNSLIDDTMRADIQTMYDELQTERKQLVGEHYTLMMIETTLDNESAETSQFIGNLIEQCNNIFVQDYYLIGNSVMNYEMEQSFDQELLTITILTALSVFLVVAITFRSIVIPAILVAIVQCGVYVTVTSNGILGYSIYYLALLIVQCILMGATIDYAILYTTYYQEFRREYDILESLTRAYNGSIHTILTSGLIITIVTGVLGFMSADPTIAQICRVISIGAASAITLILFILPSLLAAFDKFVVKKNK